MNYKYVYNICKTSNIIIVLGYHIITFILIIWTYHWISLNIDA